MKVLLFLLYSMEILGALLCGAQHTPETVAVNVGNGIDQANSTESSTVLPSSPSGPYPKPNPYPNPKPNPYPNPKPNPNPNPTTVSKSPSTSPSPGPQSSNFGDIFTKKECLPVLMVTGGLIIACTILLVSSLLLAWKVCQLSSRIKALSSNTELIGISENEMRITKKCKSEAEPGETSVLVSDFSQTQEEGHGAAKEEGGKVNEDGQMGDKKEEEGEAANSEEASTTPATAAENSSSSKPQEEATDTQPMGAVTASTSEGTEDPKDVV